jgi:hypothetical protein
MARKTCPAMLMVISSPTPDSASSVTNVWGLLPDASISIDYW